MESAPEMSAPLEAPACPTLVAPCRGGGGDIVIDRGSGISGVTGGVSMDPVTDGD